MNLTPCDRLQITGTKAERPGLTEALSHLREGDTLVVWRLDRLGRSLKHLIETVTALQSTGVAFQSITENINTSTATGQLVFHIFGALAEFERNLIRERSIAGLSAARARGRKGGRPKQNSSSGKVAMAKKLYADKTNTGSSPSLRPSAKARHTRPKCAFAYCVHFADHTPCAGSA
jgi:DNA invertase Pin-like site-specific DNA recombinase